MIALQVDRTSSKTASIVWSPPSEQKHLIYEIVTTSLQGYEPDQVGKLQLYAYMLCYCQHSGGGPNGIEAWSLGLLFLQCFDNVGWVF